MTRLRIFSYLPNPRVWKATIAARFCGVELEIRGAPAGGLKGWLWDYDARPLAEGEADASIARVGRTGLTGAQLFKTVARLGQSSFPLYGRDAFEASRIDSFLDVSLVFARDSQIYLLSLMDGSVNEAIQARARDAFATYASGIDQALS